MGWSIGFDTSWDRDIGYGVPAYCDHPKCNEDIDRGLAHVCGGEPYGGDHGCGLYFCPKHLVYSERHGEWFQACARCAVPEDEGGQQQPPFEPKSEHPRWMRHVIRDASWAQWRSENPAKVAAFRIALRAVGQAGAT